MKLLIVLISFSLLNVTRAYLNLKWEAANPAFDPAIYENALDPEECARQLEYITQTDNLALRLQFVESGLRIPRSILSGNTEDWGNYHQCLGISQEVEDIMEIEGKYCTINVPADQISDIEIPSWMHFNPNHLIIDDKTRNEIRKARIVDDGIQTLNGRKDEERFGVETLQSVDFTLALCIPKPCTTQEGLDNILINLTSVGFQYEDKFCRMKNDKPWVPVDYVAVVVFSIIILLTILSSSYDLWHTYRLKSDPKTISKVYQSFSVYTNTRRLLTFHSNPGALECVDGIRSIAMMWVILGHSFSTLPQRLNLLDSYNWTLAIDSIWVTSAPISVDTFFMISGMLLVYTTAGKMTGMKLLQTVHLFYLNRLLRMFPLLAAAVLFQASFLYRLADGPMWDLAAGHTNNCRKYWWSTLLYVQNFANGPDMCLPHSWYLAIDIQLHILSPLILFWVLSGNKKAAWIALASGLLAFLAGSAIYNFIKEFPSAVVQPGRASEYGYYMIYYYINTLTRASPFFVGMIFGYLLHLCRGKKVELSKASILILWLITLTLTSLVIYSCHPMKDMNWNNQTLDSLINTFTRPAWALGLGWIIFACSHGYGGPINWFLSLQMWKLPSRLSYGMYLFHYPMMYVTAGTAIAPIFFTPISTVYRFLSEFSIAILVSFATTLVIDSPFSTLIKLVMGGGPKKHKNEPPIQEKAKETDEKFNPAQTKNWGLENELYPREKFSKTML